MSKKLSEMLARPTDAKKMRQPQPDNSRHFHQNITRKNGDNAKCAVLRQEEDWYETIAHCPLSKS